MNVSLIEGSFIYSLAIETATSHCSAAILKGDEALLELNQETNRLHNETLPGLVDRLISETDVSYCQLSFLSVSIGPGSFTGLRVGLSFAKGIAVARQIPVIPVETLPSLALRYIECYSEFPETERICPIVPARRGEVFGAIYRFKRPDILESEPVQLADKSAIEHLQSAGVTVCGEGVRWLGITDEVEITASATVVGRCGLRRLMNGEPLPSPASLEPLYLKEFTIKARNG